MKGILLALALALASAIMPRPRQAPVAVQAPALQTIAVVGGQPDDITTDGQGRLVWGDLARGTVERLDGAHITVLARGIRVPEGIVVLPNGTLVVAEQGYDRLLYVDRTGQRRVILSLRPVAGQDGVDGIGRDPRTGDLLVPDSPRGTLLRVRPDGRNIRTLARGLGRPVDAARDAQGNVLVPDEHLGTLAVIASNGQVTYRGRFATPDDVAIDRSGNVWVTSLGDGGLWLLRPGRLPQRVLGGLANPQGLTLDRCGDPVVVEQNAARIVRLLWTAGAARCRF